MSLSLRTWSLFSRDTTYSGLKSLSTSTPRRDHGSALYAAGTSAALRGRSRMCPMDDSTSYSDPRRPEIVLALAGDSTMTRGLAIGPQLLEEKGTGTGGRDSVPPGAALSPPPLRPSPRRAR